MAPAPVVGWTTAPTQAMVEIAPGLRFSGTFPRLVAYIIDGIIVTVMTLLVDGLVGTGASLALTTRGDVSFAAVVIGVAVDGVYFVWFWSGGRRATPGQRLLSIQVGHAFDGAPLTLEQAVRRWLAFGTFLGLFGVTAGLSAAMNGIGALWSIALLISTISSPTKQGLHDRFAESAVVRPTEAGNGLMVGCLVLAGLFIVLPLIAIIALIALGSQVSDILVEIGKSV